MEVAVVQSSGCCSDVLTQGNRLLQGGLAEPLPELTQEQLLEERARIKAALYAEYGTEIQRLLAEQAEHRIHHLAQETDADAGSHPLILHTEANKQLKVLQKESMDRLRQEIADSGKTFAEAEEHLNKILNLQSEADLPTRVTLGLATEQGTDSTEKPPAAIEGAQ